MQVKLCNDVSRVPGRRAGKKQVGGKKKIDIFSGQKTRVKNGNRPVR
jgi:hypothetical protein